MVEHFVESVSSLGKGSRVEKFAYVNFICRSVAAGTLDMHLTSVYAPGYVNVAQRGASVPLQNQNCQYLLLAYAYLGDRDLYHIVFILLFWHAESHVVVAGIHFVRNGAHPCSPQHPTAFTDLFAFIIQVP